MLPAQIGEKVHKALPLLALDDPLQAYRSTTSQWRPGDLGLDEPSFEVWDRVAGASLADPVAVMQLMDTATYLPGDILTKVDRASMAVSLEARVPLLDHRVVEFGWSLPARFKIRGQTGKFAIREILARHLPRRLFERPKAGFTVPIAEWLRGPLSDWAAGLLEDPGIEHDLGLDATLIRQRWHEHRAGRRNWQGQLWTLLSLVQWHRAAAGIGSTKPGTALSR